MEMRKRVLFDLGRVVATHEALRALDAVGMSAQEFLNRHVDGDFGEADADANSNALCYRNDQIISIYILPDAQRLWIVTEANRSATTIHLEEQY